MFLFLALLGELRFGESLIELVNATRRIDELHLTCKKKDETCWRSRVLLEDILFHLPTPLYPSSEHTNVSKTIRHKRNP